MRRLPISRIVHGLMIAATLTAIAVVFFLNIFPPHDDAVLIDKSSSVSSSKSADSSESLLSEPGVGSSGGDEVISQSSSNGKININTASLSELMTLDGIGETRAKAIIEYRDAHGNFSSIDDLVLVSGIGEKTLEKNRARIEV